MLYDLIGNDIFDALGIDKDVINSVNNYFKSYEQDYVNKMRAAWLEKRKSFVWTIEEWEHTKEFDEKYIDGKNYTYYALKNNKYKYSLELFSFNANDIKKFEEQLNTKRFIELTKVYEDRYSDSVMESCHGKNWKKTHSPYHLSTYNVIFDTQLGDIIYETNKESCHFAYIKFFDNVAEISQDSHKTIYFDMPNKKVIAEGNYDKVESNDYIIIGISHYYGDKKERATIINKHTCEVSTLY